MPESDTKRGYLLAAITIVIWTGFIIVSRVGGTGTLTPFDVVAIRLATAALIVLPLWIRGGCKPLLEPRTAALTATGGLGYTSLVFSAFHLAPAAHAGILLSGFQPFAMALCAWAVLGERPSRQRGAGMVVIAAGGATLAYGVFQGDLGTSRGDLMFIAASAFWALYTVLARRWRVSPWDVTINVAILAALVYLPVYAIALPKHLQTAALSEITLQAGYQGALAAVIQMVIYMRAVELLGPSRMGVLVALVPPLAAAAAVPILHEPMTPVLAVSLLLVSAGVYVGNGGPSLARATRCTT